MISMKMRARFSLSCFANLAHRAAQGRSNCLRWHLPGVQHKETAAFLIKQSLCCFVCELLGGFDPQVNPLSDSGRRSFVPLKAP